MGLNHAYFGVGGQGVQRGYEGEGRILPFVVQIAHLRWDLLIMFNGTGINAQCSTGKKKKFRLCLPLSSINFY